MPYSIHTTRIPWLSKICPVNTMFMFVNHLINPDLRVEIFFKKEGATEKKGVDLEIGDSGASA